MAVGKVTDADFAAEVEQSDKPVLVDFWADWCGPCHMMAPILDEFEAKHGDSIKVVKLDVDANPATQQAYKIMSLPTMLLIDNGEAKTQLVGVTSMQRLEEALAEWVSSKA